MLNLSPKIVIFDTEYTTWEGAMEREWSGPNEYKEIVQIGAVLIETKNFTEIDSFNVLVRPQKNPVLSDFFANLTGITQEMVDKDGVDFLSAIQKFFEWAGSYDIYSWGGDPKVLEENCGLLGIKFPFEKPRFLILKMYLPPLAFPLNNI